MCIITLLWVNVNILWYIVLRDALCRANAVAFLQRLTLLELAAFFFFFVCWRHFIASVMKCLDTQATSQSGKCLRQVGSRSPKFHAEFPLWTFCKSGRWTSSWTGWTWRGTILGHSFFLKRTTTFLQTSCTSCGLWRSPRKGKHFVQWKKHNCSTPCSLTLFYNLWFAYLPLWEQKRGNWSFFYPRSLHKGRPANVIRPGWGYSCTKRHVLRECAQYAFRVFRGSRCARNGPWTGQAVLRNLSVAKRCWHRATV